MEELKGYVDHVIYQNSDNAYTVLVLVVEDEEVTVTGIFPGVSDGENLSVTGEFKNHPTYGEQFAAKSFAVIEPEGEAAIERYLASGAIRGIGPKLANRIVKAFGEDTFRIMEEEPERLSEVKGISASMAAVFSDQIVEKRDLRDAMMFLEGYGIRNALAIRIYNRYGAETYSMIRTNPYRMAEEVEGVGFKIADDIARRAGIRVDSEFRIRCGVLYTLTEGAANGHTYLPREILLNHTAALLDVPAEMVEEQLDNLAIDHKIRIRGEAIYHSMYDRMEENTAGLLLSLDELTPEDTDALTAKIKKIEAKSDLELDQVQRQAVIRAATHGVSILTGGPGTGKTTTIRVMIEYFMSQGDDVFLAAPTGRAAKRMSEATGYEARTIHRMLEVSGNMEEDAGSNFERNRFNPLECDVVIVDEMSMVDIHLMYALVSAIPEHCRLILVGDINQLPSVGPGNVLRDLIESGQFSVVTLNRIFRQAAESDIVVNAHKINNGEEISLDNSGRDFFLLKRYDANRIISTMLTLIQEKLPSYVEARPLDIQVLTPTRKGLIGVERLNSILQEYLNPPSKDKSQYESGERIFRQGDKVMQIKNNYQLEWVIYGKYGLEADKGEGVFNGDMGEIIEVNPYSKSLTVRYDEARDVEYPFTQLDELELAYAVTIHKSQGSEYPAVLIPLLPGPAMLYNRNLLYTAVTRAKRCVILVGDEKVFFDMIKNTSQQRRYTGLRERLENKGSEVFGKA